MIPAEVMTRLATLGLEPEHARAVAEMLSAVETATKAEGDAAIEARRANDRERKARQRHVNSRDVTGQDGTSGTDIPRARVEDNLPTKDTSGRQDKKNTKREDEDEFRADLASDLPADLLDGIIKVRRDKRGQVTGLSARYFRDDAAACGMTVAEAAKHCVSRSWITVKPEYFRGKQGPPNAPPQPRNAGEFARMKLNGTIPNEPPSTDTGRLDSGNGERQIEGPGIARRFTLPPEQFSRN